MKPRLPQPRAEARRSDEPSAHARAAWGRGLGAPVPPRPRPPAPPTEAQAGQSRPEGGGGEDPPCCAESGTRRGPEVLGPGGKVRTPERRPPPPPFCTGEGGGGRGPPCGGRGAGSARTAGACGRLRAGAAGRDGDGKAPARRLAAARGSAACPSAPPCPQNSSSPRWVQDTVCETLSRESPHPGLNSGSWEAAREWAIVPFCRQKTKARSGEMCLGTPSGVAATGAWSSSRPRCLTGPRKGQSSGIS